jgi:enolase
MSFRFESVGAVEVLDSRSRPTLEVTAVGSGGVRAVAGVPSGASTGSREAVELRDSDTSRFGGAGVLGAVGHVNGEIAAALAGRSFDSLADVDAALIAPDGTETKARLGANAIVGVPMATARAMATSDGIELHQWLCPDGVTRRLPVPHFNVINGGAHAQNPLDFQEFMIAPLGAPSFAEALRAGAEIYAALRARLHEAGMATGLGDEGGFAPDIATPEEVLGLLVDAIGSVGYTPGRDGVAIALDPAASEFFDAGVYRVAGESLSAADMIERYAAIVDRFPVWSIEDGLAEGDRDGWVALTERLGDRIQLVGDDNFVTNPAIIADAIHAGIANAALIKLNQVRTVTETLDAMRVCRDAGYAADGVAPLGGDARRVHRGSDRRDRVRAAQVRRPGPRGAGREVQPAPGDRSGRTRPRLRARLWARVAGVGRVARCSHRPARAPGQHSQTLEESPWTAPPLPPPLRA